ncbi:hypothetical protein PV728_31965 [Streptomyces europaeiscabiei]|uniref:hypothetical protein n=1 Tax=Streptomyces europaeiscabiei TaxID=146819 RepID=UPI0029AFBAEF|nr:hypothetical protein [Streptomyces europaeiscabiei]MDX3634794.1 hypothetical protein [Streptomyces europaeiscabiei]MDX3652750.1 hypothetical protein [Streptomyces europaeiscabiei]
MHDVTHSYAEDRPPHASPPLHIARAVARQFLAEAERIDYERPALVVASHAALTSTLRRLLAALDAEDGGQ